MKAKYSPSVENKESTNSRTDIFRELVHLRRSVRKYLPKPVPADVIQRVLEDSQRTPSNSNTQPWNVHIVSGKKREELSSALMAAVQRGEFSMDFSYGPQDYCGVYAKRYAEQGEIRNKEQGISRDDAEARMKSAMQNYTFFNAPHVALLFMPQVGDNVRAAADVGMYGQTFLLSLVAHGLSGVPQTSIGMLAKTVRDVLGISDDMKLLFAISFGYPEEDELEKTPMPRATLAESVTFHE